MKKIIFVIFTLFFVIKSFGQNPIVTLNGITSPLCQNYYFVPTATVSNCALGGSNTYSWSFPGGTPSTSTSASPPSIYYYVDGSHVISLTVTNNCGTTTKDSTIMVQTVPKPDPMPNLIVCAGDIVPAINFSSATPGASYYWTNDNIAIGLEASGGTLIHSFTAGSVGAIGTLKISSYLASNSCPASFINFTITTVQKPVAPTVSSNFIPYCTGSTAAQLTATATGSNVLYWYTVASGGIRTTTAPTPSTTSQGNTGYWVSQGLASTSCESDRTQITVAVFQTPAIAIGSFTNTTNCNSSTGTITLTGLNANTNYTVNYSATSGSVQLTSASNAAGNLIISGLPSDTYSNITVTLNNCISNTVGPKIITDPVPPGIPKPASNSPVCSGNTLNLTSNSTIFATGTVTYAWTGPNGFTSTVQNPSITNTTTAASGTYSVIVTQNSCVTTAGTVTVVINQTPGEPAASSNSPVCTGTTLSLTGPSGALTYAWTGPNSFTSTNQSPFITSASLAAAGTYSLIVTSTTGSCVSAAGTTAVSMLATPVISATSTTNSSNCNSATGSIVLNGLVASTTYQVTYTKGSTTTVALVSDATGKITISGLLAGTYSTIYVTLSGCPSASVGPLVISDPVPPGTPTPSSNSPVCSGNTLTLNSNSTITATGTVTYAWTGPNSFSSTNQNPSITNTSISANGTYSVVVTQNSCVTAAGTVNVVINATPGIPTTSSNSPVCTGTSISLTGPSGALTYSWTGPNSFASTSQNPTVTNSGIAAAGTYSLIVTSTTGSCVSAAGTTVVNMLTTPVIAGTGSINTTNCGSATGSISLTGLIANNTYQVTYTKGTSLTSSLVANASGIIVIPGLTAGTYSTIFVSLTGCSSASVGPVVITDPVAPGTPVPTSNSAICSGSTLNLFTNSTITAAGTVTYAWTGPNSFTSTSQNPSITNATISASGTYSAIVTQNSCVTAAGTVTVVVNPTPAVPTMSSNTPVCTGTTINLTSISGALTYSWTGPNSFTSTSQNPTIPSAILAAGGTYSLVVTSTTGSCVSVAGTTAVSMLATPAISGSIITNTTNCGSSTGSIALTGLIANTTYQVTYTKTATTTTSALLSDATGKIIIPGLQAGSYSYIYVTLSGCSSGSIGPLVVSDPVAPTTPAPTSNSAVCTGSTLNLVANSTITASGAVTYAWTGPNSFTSTTMNPSINNVTTAAGGTYSVIATQNSCITAAGTVNVVINATPGVPATSSNSPVCTGTTLLLTGPSTGVTYSWTGPNSFSSTSQNPSIPTASLTAGGTYNLIVTSTAGSCVSAAGTTTVTMLATPAISGSSVTNTTNCGASTGTISLAGLTANTTYQVNYTRSSTTTTVVLAAGSTGTLAIPGLPAGIYNSIYVVLAGCQSNTVGGLIINDPVAPGTPAPTSNSPVCSGNTLSLIANSTITATGTVTYAWTGPNGFSSSIQNPTIANSTVAASGSYAVVVTQNSCVTAAGSINVVISQTPATPATGSNSPVCSGTTLSLTGPSGASAYSWTGPNSFTSTSQNPTITTADSTQKGIYSLTIIQNGCASPAGTVTVVINPTPTISSLTNNTPICSGSTLSFTSASNFAGSLTYAWTGPNSYTATAQNPTIFSAPTIASGAYTLIVTSAIGSCASASVSTLVTVKPSPVISSAAGTGPTDCFSSTGYITLSGLTASANFQVAYTKNSDPSVSMSIASSASGTLVIPNLLAATYSQISVTLSGCISNMIASVTLVSPPPAMPVATSNTPVCNQGNSLTLFSSTTTTGIITYNWTGPNGFASTMQNPVIANVTTAATGTYYVTATFSGCTTNPGSTNVVINQTPSTPTITSNTPICSGGILSLTSVTTFTGQVTNAWTGPNNFTSTAQNPNIPTATVAASGNYQLIQTAVTGNCPSTAATTAAVVNPTPVIGSVVFTNPTNCSSATGTISLKFLTAATAYQTSYQNGSGVNTTAIMVADATGTILISNLSAQTYSLIHVVLAGCASQNFSVTLSDPPIPATPTATVQSVVCNGGTLQLLGSTTTTGVVTYNWTYPSGVTSTSQNPVINNATVAQSGNYTVTVTQNSCVSALTNLSVTIHPIPAAPIVSNVAYCINATASPLTATNSAGNSLSWYTTATGGTGTATGFTPTTTATGIQNYYVSQVSAYGCESIRTLITVTVNPNAIAQFTPPLFTKCAPFVIGTADINLQQYPNNDSLYNWYVNGAFIGSGTNFPGYTVLENSTAVVRLNTTSLFGCAQANATQTFYAIYPHPAFSISVNGNCGSFLTAFQNTTPDNAGFTYHWDFGNGQTYDGIQPAGVAYLTNPITGRDTTYQVKLTVNSICGPISTTQSILVKAIPATSFSTPNTKGCSTSTIVFTNSTTGTNSYTWDFGDGVTSNASTTTVQHAYTVSNLTAYTVKLIAVGSNGCADTLSKLISIYPKPYVSITANTVSCTNTAVLFTANTQSVDALNALQWTISNGVNQSGATLNYIFTSAGNYSIRFIGGTVNACYDTAYRSIQVNASPVITSSGNFTVCRGSSTQMHTSGSVQYLWSPAQTLNCTNCADPVATPLTNTNYIVQATSNGCTTADTILATVIQPFHILRSGNDTICSGQSVNLQITGATSYKWTPAYGLSNTTIFNPVANPAVTTNYTVVGYDAYNCFTDTAYRIVAVGQTPVVNLGADKVLEAGITIPLLSTITNGPITTWLWTPAANLDCANCALPLATIKKDVTYILKATNAFGCFGFDTLNIKSFCEKAQIFVPNAFTPDGDGINDVLMIRASGILTVKLFKIYNRWGEVVFEKINFSPNDPRLGWDGKIKGKVGPPEVYIYTAEVLCENGVSFTYKGNTTLLK